MITTPMKNLIISSRKSFLAKIQTDIAVKQINEKFDGIIEKSY